jgi:hypothetical protein
MPHDPLATGGPLLPPSAMDAIVESIRNTTLTTKRLSSLLMAHNRWTFGTVMRPRDARNTERVMVVGNRQVTTLTNRRGRVLGVEHTVDDWFDYWEVEPTS